MSRLQLKSHKPDLSGLIESFPMTGLYLNELMETLLVRDLPGVRLPRWVREYIAGSVCGRGDAIFGANLHFAVARLTSPYLRDVDVHRAVIETPMWGKLEQLAHTVYLRASTVTQGEVDDCRYLGATDEEIHLAILIGAACKMYNAYVKALRPDGPMSGDMIEAMAQTLATKGYVKH